MHAEVCADNYFTSESMGKHYFFVLLDVLITFFLFSLFFRRNMKWTYSLSYISITLFCLVNIGYSRYYHSYFPLEMIAAMSNFSDSSWCYDYFVRALRTSDIIILINTSVFVVFMYVFRKRLSESRIKIGLLFSAILLCAIGYILIMPECDQVSLRSAEQMKRWFRFNGYNSFLCDETFVVHNKGIYCGYIYGNLLFHTESGSIAPVEKKKLNNYVQNMNKVQGDGFQYGLKNTPNVVFIIVESYMSIASDTSFNGKQVTPNLNRLRCEPGVYYSGTMRQNTGVGVSSDAQVLYFTGMLPSRNTLSLSYILRNKMIAFPKLMSEQKGYHTYMSIPTRGSFWHQIEVNSIYGQDSLMSIGEWCDDDVLFEESVKYQHRMRQPFLHTIVTLSMHGTYSNDFLKEHNIKSPFDYPDDMSIELQHYFDKCYFTDFHIGRFLDKMRAEGTYDDTVIIIAADHSPSKEDLDFPDAKLHHRLLPLFIANTGLPVESFVESGTHINQVDVFSTMLDLFDLKSSWRGFGKSLLRSQSYSNILTEDMYAKSSMMLISDYFGWEESE